MRVHIGIVTYNRIDLTKICLESLLEKTATPYTLTIVDNGSSDGTADYLSSLAARHTHIKVHLLQKNMGVAPASNLAWDDAGDDAVFIKLDNDVEIVDPEWIERLLNVLATNPQLNPIGYQLVPKHKGTPIKGKNGEDLLSCDCCNGACAAISPLLHAQLGFWNESFGTYGYEDLEYSWRALKAGFQPVYIPTHSLKHHGYEPAYLNDAQEKSKFHSRTRLATGSQIYLLHLLLYDLNLLNLKTVRKFVPKEKEGVYSFTINPHYRPIQKLVSHLLRVVNIEQNAEMTHFDLRALIKENML